MGLDISHGCWTGAYSSFNRWRKEIAFVAGYPPLDLMEGFYNTNDWKYTFRDQISFDLWVYKIAKYLPIKWDKWQDDPLTVLLYHSDCDGIIEHKYLLPLAKRLEGLLSKLPTIDDDGHIGNWRTKTQVFIDGLKLADSLGEDIGFH